MTDNIDDVLQFYVEDIKFNEETFDKSSLDSGMIVNPNFDASKSTGRFVEGYASTQAWDSDNESIVQAGLDISYYTNQGYLNWMHKNEPSHIVGIPVASKIDHKGFWTKGMLFKENSIADGIWKTASELKELGNPRKMGFSIEGKVVKRSAINKSKIVKAKVTNVAITHIPVNTTCTFDVVTKSFVPPAYDDIVSYIMKDMDLSKNITAMQNAGQVAGHSWGSSNYIGSESQRIESLHGVDTRSQKELEERLSSAYKNAKKSHDEMTGILKSIYPNESDILLEEISHLVIKSEGFDNFAKILEISGILTQN